MRGRREWEEAEATAPTRNDGPGRLSRLRAAVQAARRRLDALAVRLRTMIAERRHVLADLTRSRA